MPDATFFFDPACPWTWRASRWLTVVADALGLDVEWRPLSLLVLNDWKPPEEHRAAVEATHGALRLVERLHQAGRQGDSARFYEALGTLAHEGGAPIDGELVALAVREAGLEADASALDDRDLDPGVTRSTEAAMAAAGPGVGSPVIVLAGTERGFHGPVLGTVPDKAQSLALWDAVEALAPIGEFFEIKRGRG